MHGFETKRMAIGMGIGLVVLLSGLWVVFQLYPIKGASLAITISDHAVQSNAKVVAAGKVKLVVTNQGTTAHELIVLKTNLPAHALTLKDTSGSLVDEDASGSAVDEMEDIAVGQTKQMILTLTPGEYVLFCNLPDHYKMGVFTQLQVK